LSRLSVIDLPTLRITSSKRLPSTMPLANALLIDFPKASADLFKF
jgi:hypothetical protein